MSAWPVDWPNWEELLLSKVPSRTLYTPFPLGINLAKLVLPKNILFRRSNANSLSANGFSGGCKRSADLRSIRGVDGWLMAFNQWQFPSTDGIALFGTETGADHLTEPCLRSHATSGWHCPQSICETLFASGSEVDTMNRENFEKLFAAVREADAKARCYRTR